jgi:hypothetical protein
MRCAPSGLSEGKTGQKVKLENMKAPIKGVVGAVAVILASAPHTPAIEGLRLSVQCSNVVLSWPSQEGETYIVQYRSDLTSTNSWATLTNYLPANIGTNLSFFIHSNLVRMANCGRGSFGALTSTGDEQNSSAMTPTEGFEPTVPMAMRADGTGSAVPLALYPPGFDLSGFVVLAPSSGGTFSASEYSAAVMAADDTGIPSPEEGSGLGGGTTNASPETGFYRVVRNGVHLWGITNGTTLSGVVTISVEAQNDFGVLTHLSLNENGSPVSDLSMVENPVAPLLLTIDTTQMSNGVHQIEATAEWYLAGADSPYYAADSPPVMVNIYNEISFPNWIPEFGQLYDSLDIAVQSAHADAEWYIDVYGANAGYIGTFGGHTYDGNIEVVWDLIGPPPDFHSYADEPYFQFVVETDWTNGQVQANGPQAAGSAISGPSGILKNWDQWAAPGDWVVANQLFWGDWVGGENLNTMTDSFEQMAEEGYGLTVRPGHLYHEAFRIHYNDSQELSSWLSFRQALYHPNLAESFLFRTR